MSLTSFLKTPGIAGEFQRFFPFKEQSFAWPLLAPPISPRPPRIGTAFDYLLRFHLQKQHDDPKRLKKQMWIAAGGVGLRRGQADEKSAKEAFQQAQQRFLEFQQGVPCDDGLIESCLHLAQFDEMVRESPFPFDPIAPEIDVRDLRALLDLVPWHRFAPSPRPQFPPLFNPTFGLGSAVVGGADADFWLGNTLFELKTVRAARITPQMHFQLMGYCALHELSPDEDGPRREIEQIAIYFSRFGKILRFNVAELIQSAKFDDFLQWFAPCGARRFGSEPILGDMRRLRKIEN